MAQTEEQKPTRGRVIVRRTGLLLLLGAVAAGVSWGVAQLRDPQLLPVRVVRIDGSLHHLQRAALEQAVASRLHGGFFTVDVAAVQEAVGRLPWVDRTRVRLIWPGTLQVTVEEQVPLVRWQKSRLLNQRGEVFDPAGSEPAAGLPLLSGPDGSEREVLGRYRDVQARLQPLGREVQELRLDARRSWTLQLDDGLVIRLGNKEVEARLTRFFRVYPRLQQMDTRLQEMDLRYPNGFAVRADTTRPGEAPAAMNLRRSNQAPGERGLT
jgi:cell division protein FtsQ